MTAKLRVHHLADSEYLDAVQWYKKRSLYTAIGFVDDADHAIALSLENPTSWQSDEGIYKIHFRKYPYTLVYYVVDDEVIVIAFQHQSRLPKYWTNRKG